MATERPRILVVTRNFPPLVGGIERVMHRAVGTLATVGDVALVGPCGAEPHAPSATHLATAPASPMPRFLLGAAAAAARLAVQFRPTVVFAASGLVAPIALAVGRATGARTLGYVYGLDLVVQHALYQRAWLPAIRRLDALLAISQPTKEAAAERGIAPAKVTVLHPGVDMRVGDGARFRRKFGFGDAPLLLSLGRLNQRKGLVPFVERALPDIVRAIPATHLVVIGADATDAGTHAESVSAGILRAAVAAGLSERVHLLGRLDDQDVADALAAATIFVFPVVDIPGDMEGFGMVAIEAAANGAPTLAFAVGGIVDAVVPGESGDLVPSGDYAAFVDRCVEWLCDPASRPSAEQCRTVARRYGWGQFDARLLDWFTAQMGKVQ